MDVAFNIFSNIPPMTRLFCTGCVLLTVAVHMELLTQLDVYYNPGLIFYRGQIWRLWTSFFYLGKMDMSFLFNVVFAYRHSYLLETSTFAERLPELVVMWVFGWVVMLILAAFTGAVILNQSLTLYLIYVWSRRNTHIAIDFLGVITFPAPYFPMILLATSFVVGQDNLAELIGFWAGHMYYHLEYVFPNTKYGFRLIRTPKFLQTWLDRSDESIPEVHDETVEVDETTIRIHNTQRRPMIENAPDNSNNTGLTNAAGASGQEEPLIEVDAAATGH